jgi:hypothetical protein
MKGPQPRISPDILQGLGCNFLITQETEHADDQLAYIAGRRICSLKKDDSTLAFMRGPQRRQVPACSG